MIDMYVNLPCNICFLAREKRGRNISKREDIRGDTVMSLKQLDHASVAKILVTVDDSDKMDHITHATCVACR